MGTDALRDELSRLLLPIGQEDVLRWWEELLPKERENLAREVRGLDTALLGELAWALPSRVSAEATPGKLTPPEIIRPSRLEPARLDAAHKRGEAAIRAGKVACFMVAGGQASRLGIDGPKGAFPIGPVSGKSLFRIHAEKILATTRRFRVNIPWVILTSAANDEETRGIFDEERSFGLDARQVHFLRQGSLPAFDPSGRILLRSKSEIFLGPDGHGGALRALWKGEILGQLIREGKEVLSYFQVDNPLVPAVDPLFLGLHLLEGAEVSSKVAEKTDPEEKVGVFARREDALSVVEYTEVSREDRSARNEAGGLLYWGGNLAIHAWSLSFLDRLRAEGVSLPYHPSLKVVPSLDASGLAVSPASPNGIKFEAFIFDSIPLARKGIVVEVRREEEFQPVKSATGRDTPEEARRAISRLHAGWLEAVTTVPRDPSGEPRFPIEVSPLYAMSAEELRRKAPRDLKIRGPLYLAPTDEGAS